MGKLVLKAHEVVRFSLETSDKEIRAYVKTETGLSVRRLDNVTLTSLNALYRLMANNKTSEYLALYSGAEYMSVDLFQSVIIAMENKEAIRPYDFIATVGNAANFYLSKEFAIKGPNVFIGASENCLLKAGLLAETDIMLGHCQQAVIVIWHTNNKERRCHALLVEKATESEERSEKFFDSAMNNEEFLSLAARKELPIILDFKINL